MKTTTRRPRQRLNEKLGDYNARLRMWLEENNASRYAVQHVKHGGELTEEEIDRNIAAVAAQIAEEPLPPIHLAPSYKPHKHAEDERLGDDEAPAAAPIELDYLQSQIAALTARVVDLEKLVASTVAYRSLKAAAKAKVDRIDPSIGAAFKDRRTLLALTIYDHVAELPWRKKTSANFPRELKGSQDLSGDRPQDNVTCRVIPYTALLHRLAAKKDFQPSQDETTSQENARLAIERSGLYVTTMHEASIRNGSALLVVMDRVEAAARGLVKGLAPVPKPEQAPAPDFLPRATFDKGAWRDVKITDEVPESKPNPAYVTKPKDGYKSRFAEWDESEGKATVDVVDDEVIVTLPTTEAVEDLEPRYRGAVYEEPNLTDDEEIDTETEWETAIDEGFQDDPIELFRESGEQEKAVKSSKAIDLFS